LGFAVDIDGPGSTHDFLLGLSKRNLQNFIFHRQ